METCSDTDPPDAVRSLLSVNTEGEGLQESVPSCDSVPCECVTEML